MWAYLSRPMHNVPVFLGLGTTGLKGQAHSQIGLFSRYPIFFYKKSLYINLLKQYLSYYPVIQLLKKILGLFYDNIINCFMNNYILV
jgi:hypothetical protein